MSECLCRINLVLFESALPGEIALNGYGSSNDAEKFRKKELYQLYLNKLRGCYNSLLFSFLEDLSDKKRWHRAHPRAGAKMLRVVGWHRRYWHEGRPWLHRPCLHRPRYEPGSSVLLFLYHITWPTLAPTFGIGNLPLLTFRSRPIGSLELT